MSSKFRLTVLSVIATSVFLVSAPQNGFCWDYLCCKKSDGSYFKISDMYGCENQGGNWNSATDPACSNAPTINP